MMLGKRLGTASGNARRFKSQKIGLDTAESDPG